MIYAIDSNIISYFLKKNEDIRSRVILETEKNNQFVIPPIVYFEVKRWLLEKQTTVQMREFEELCKRISVGEMDRSVWDKAVELYVSTRRKGTPVDDADLLIAAFCIVNDYVLVTNNTRHFAVIDTLQYVNWK